jgi:hypothetical protein
MTASQVVVEEEKDDSKILEHQSDFVRFRGKDIETEKLRKKLSHKPRLFGPILINISIILALIIIILLVFHQ